MFYTVYKTTHTESGKIYIGMHATARADDSYLGSGKLISHAISKYGREAFSKEVLFVFATPEEMIAKEKELVDEAFCARNDTYNLNVGGDGGWFRANQVLSREDREEIGRKGQAAYRNRLSVDLNFKDSMGEISRANLGRARTLERVPYGKAWTGRSHSEDTKRLMRESHSTNLHQEGSSNSQYGTSWMWKAGLKAKKATPEEVPLLFEQGWTLGRHDPLSISRKPRRSRAGRNALKA